MVAIAEPAHDDLEGAYRCAYRQLRRVALRFVAADEADDLVHDAFVRALTAEQTFRHAASPTTWLHRIVINTGLNNQRNQKRQKRHAVTVTLIEALNVATASPHPAEACAVRRALAALAVDHKHVCVLHDVIGFSHAEIAGALGIAPSTSKSRLSAARHQLRTTLGSLSNHNGTPPTSRDGRTRGGGVKSPRRS